MTAHFFFNDTATTEIYTLSLHDALPICEWQNRPPGTRWPSPPALSSFGRSEEHTSELQSRPHLVCRLLLEKKKIYKIYIPFRSNTRNHCLRFASAAHCRYISFFFFF